MESGRFILVKCHNAEIGFVDLETQVQIEIIGGIYFAL